LKRQLRCQQKQIDALPRGFPPQRSGHSGLRATRAAFRIQSPKAVEVDIASGDKFFSDRADLADLLIHLPTIAAVDMESAAVAQVCHEYSVPFTVVRTISDAADGSLWSHQTDRIGRAKIIAASISFPTSFHSVGCGTASLMQSAMQCTGVVHMML